jgi:glycosyltransferase involved in cell wall biosynthesis
MPIPVPPPHPSDRHAARRRLGVNDATCVVLTGFDFRSSSARKNPEAAIAAYIAATPDDGRARLVIKASGANETDARLQALRSLASERSDITIIAERLSSEELSDLLAGADVLISLHRAEGFGLWLAEAMRAGKPVIATGWSGNMQFMDDRSAALVPYSMTPIVDPDGPYASEQGCWAEPDVGAAASCLERLIGDPAARAALGARGAKGAAALDRAYERSRLSPAFLAALATD